MAKYTYSNADHNRFFLKLMIVKAKIIFNSLPPDKPEVPKAKEFDERFKALYARTNNSSRGQQLTQLNQDAYDTTKEFRSFVLEILGKQLTQNFI